MPKSAIWNPKQLFPGLIVFTIFYQVVYNIMLFDAVTRDEGQEECPALPGVGNPQSPRCLEVNLFRSWHEAELNNPEDDGLLQHNSGADTSDIDVIHDHSVITTVISYHTHHIGEGLDSGALENQSVLDARMKLAAEAQQRHTLMDQLEKKIRMSLENSTNVTPWAKDLVDLQSHLEEEMQANDMAHHRKKATVEKIDRVAQNSLDPDSLTPWAKDLMALRNHLESEMNASDTAMHARAQARHARHMAQHANITNELASRMTNLESHLSHLASKRKAWEASLLDKYGVPESTTPAPKSFLEKRLQWSAVQSWSKTSWRPKRAWSASMSEKGSGVSRQELRHLHWGGVIPKVACITAIHSSRHTKARMMYFINNFRLQDYEGSRQLVLVYHHADPDAAELVRTYADGSYIKGLAAQGNETFPSAAALRYGAWSSDADVIARWDFEEWHDPSRLSMQIRALAMAAKPACIIREWVPERPDESKHAFGASSLVGERTWMDKHWRPLAEAEHSVLEVTQAGNVVELDMQNERRTNDVKQIKEAAEEQQENNQTDTTGNNATGTSGTRTWSMEECLEFDHENSTANGDLEKTIAQSVGVDMGKHFHGLMKRRHNISQKLQLLCLQSVLEEDAKKQEFMWQHVNQMVGIRTVLDKHIADMTSVFASS